MELIETVISSLIQYLSFCFFICWQSGPSSSGVASQPTTGKELLMLLASSRRWCDTDFLNVPPPLSFSLVFFFSVIYLKHFSDPLNFHLDFFLSKAPLQPPLRTSLSSRGKAQSWKNVFASAHTPRFEWESSEFVQTPLPSLCFCQGFIQISYFWKR